MLNRDLILFDIETSGGSIDYEIIQIGAVRLNHEFDITDNFEILIKPSTDKWDNDAFNVHKITKELLSEKGIPLYDALLKFELFNGNPRNFNLASWGYFDIDFLQKSYERINVKYPYSRRTYDIASIIRFYAHALGKFNKCGEANCASFLGITVDKSKCHNGLYDAELSAKMLKKFYLALKDKNIIEKNK